MLLYLPHDLPGLARTDLATGEHAALALALELGAALAASTTALAWGPEAGPALALALDSGCQRAVHVRDPRVTSALDDLGTAWVLAAAVRRLGAGLILCGAGPVGPALAETLAIPHVGEVVTARPAAEPAALLVERNSGARRTTYRCVAPLLLAVQPAAPPVPGTAAPGTAAPGMATEDAAGAKQRIETLDLDQLALSPAFLDQRLDRGPAYRPRPAAEVSLCADATALAQHLLASGVLEKSS